jgi:hypothetical protein
VGQEPLNLPPANKLVYTFFLNGEVMHTLLLAGLGAVIIVVLWTIAYVRRHRKPASCVNCGAPSGFGYSTQAESAMKDITRLCLNCLKAKLATTTSNLVHAHLSSLLLPTCHAMFSSQAANGKIAG